MNGLAALAAIDRARTALTTRAIRGSFASFGTRSRIVPPCRIAGAHRIEIGEDVFLHGHCWLEALAEDETAEPGLLRIGDRTQMSGHVVISSAREVLVGSDVTLARGVFVTDHNHRSDDPARPINEQGITTPRPVRIGDGSWLGHNAVVLPGVRIGENVVVGANSVVTRDVDSHMTVVGSPARLIGTR